jgi:Flp pilus assembly protein TadB
MENENQNLQEDLYEQEEKCQKAIRTVSKAMFMRLVVTLLMIFIVVSNPTQMWSWGLSAFVLLINTLGTVPLWQEYRKQKKYMKNLIAQEEA